MSMPQPVDYALVGAYLHNLQLALCNDQPQHAEALLAHIMELMTPTFAESPSCAMPATLPLSLSAGVGLDPGIKRRGAPNEDFAFIAQGMMAGAQVPYGLYVVADGMGGHANGREASRLAIESVVDDVLPQVREAEVRGASWADLLRQSVERANAAIYERNQRPTSRSAMGTTITAALIVGAEAFVANVGDSRAYLQRADVLRQITRDHSVVARLVAGGIIEPAEVYTHPKRNEIYRCLGATASVEVDVFREPLQDGDVVLLCSDGLWEMIPDERQIAGVLGSSWATADSMAERLLQLALTAGGLDNISLSVIQVRIQDITGLQTIIGPLAQSALIA